MRALTWGLGMALAAAGLFGQGTDAVKQAYDNLKAAEAKKDAAGVKQWAAETSKLAREAVKSAKDDVDGRATAEYAKQVDTYTEYSLFSTAVQSQNPADTVALVDQLREQNPKSPYVAQAIGPYLRAMQQSGPGEKAGAEAEKLAADYPDSEDALLVACDYNQGKQRQQKVLDYAGKLVALMQGKAKPEGMSDEDWTKRKNTTLGLGYWYLGLAQISENQLEAADKSLRAAVPLLPPGSSVLGMGLFNLGLADYKMAKAGTGKPNRALLQDALKYSTQSAAIKSPLQQQAAANVKAIKGELGPATRKK